MFTYKKDSNNDRIRQDYGSFDTSSSKYLSPLQSAVFYWNNTPINIREHTKSSIFKSELKTHLISKYDIECTKDKCYTCNKS